MTPDTAKQSSTHLCRIWSIYLKSIKCHIFYFHPMICLSCTVLIFNNSNKTTYIGILLCITGDSTADCQALTSQLECSAINSSDHSTGKYSCLSCFCHILNCNRRRTLSLIVQSQISSRSSKKSANRYTIAAVWGVCQNCFLYNDALGNRISSINPISFRSNTSSLYCVSCVTHMNLPCKNKIIESSTCR